MNLMNKDELVQALSSVEADNRIWVAVNTILHEMYKDDIESVTTPGMSDGDRQFAAGKLFRSADTCEGLVKLWKEAREPH